MLMILGFTLMVGCQNERENPELGDVNRDNEINQTETSPSTTPRGVFLVAEDAVVILTPISPDRDSLRYDGRAQQVLDSTTYNDIRSYAKANNLRLVESDERAVDFKKEDGNTVRFTTVDTYGNVYLFNTTKDPISLDAASFKKNEADDYFKMK